MKLVIFEAKLITMSDDSGNSYFDGSTSILAPVYIILAIGVILGVLFCG